MFNEVPDHPDIVSVNRTGYPRDWFRHDREIIGECRFCNEKITDGYEHVESCDGMFCDMDCCHSFYDIQTIY